MHKEINNSEGTVVVDRGFMKEVCDIMENYNEEPSKGEPEEQENGKYILDCAEYSPLINKSSPKTENRPTSRR